VDVLVPAGELEAAREILLGDQVDAIFDASSPPAPDDPR
jgi:hypothetical protein